jgi:rRNA pseudouridine-1189 N-methylase Emg1 (Nep1/Mra1 family)
MPDLDEELVRDDDDPSMKRRQSKPQDRILDDKEKHSIMKQRRMEKKKNR